MARSGRDIAGARIIITLTSDFGLADAYVAQVKAVLLRYCPAACLIDVTHQIAPQDIMGGAIALERAVSAFPPGTVHWAVVDPGVGTRRRLLVVHVKGQRVVCPDNGLITWAWRCHRGAKAWELIWRPAKSSATFHGRDVLAPAAGMLAAGTACPRLTRPIADPVLLPVRPIRGRPTAGQIIHIDHFGNAVTNITSQSLATRKVRGLRVHEQWIGPVRRTYGSVQVGQPVALLGSSDLLEIGVRNGSAAEVLALHVGDIVHLF